MPVPKHDVVSALRARLTADLEEAARRAHHAAEAATHEENRPESDKDMRSTEASYVARGQAERARELEHALALLAAMPIRDFAAGDAIQVSALVEVLHKGTRTSYLLVPAAGGVRVRVGDVDVQTLTTTSPLGAALLGLAEGDEAEVTAGQGTRIYEIVRVV